MKDAFPISMMENRFGPKLEAKIPPNSYGKMQFDLFINQVNFLNHDFIPMALEASKTLKGTIKLNESLFPDRGEEFEWKLLKAQNRINEIPVEDQEIRSRQIQNIDCSTGVL